VKAHRWIALGLLAAVLLIPHAGCGGADYVPLNPFLDLERRNTPEGGDGTAGVTVLPLVSVQPDEVRVGEYIRVQGRGRIFPTGFARFVFTGNSTAEVQLEQALGEIRVKVPPGTLSGAFGFTISQRSSTSLNNQYGGQNASGPAPQSFRINHPGLRVLGAAEPPGGFPNSPYPVGPPSPLYVPPDISGTL
jgi:hypothetical protein